MGVLKILDFSKNQKSILDRKKEEIDKIELTKENVAVILFSEISQLDMLVSHLQNRLTKEAMENFGSYELTVLGESVGKVYEDLSNIKTFIIKHFDIKNTEPLNSILES